MEDADVVYLWRNKLWKQIRFFFCLIINKIENFNNWDLEQNLEFYDCKFKGGLSQNRGEWYFISKVTNAISNIWMLSRHSYIDEKTGLNENMLDYVCITENRRSL